MKCRRSLEIETSYCWEPDTVVPVLCEFSITGTLSAYDPGDHYTPPSGGEIADLRAVLTSVRNLDGEPISLTLEEAGELIEQFNKLINSSGNTADLVDRHLRDAANTAVDSYDEDYERARARGWDD